MALGFDPHRLAILGIDRHLPAVPAAAMTEAALRSRFAEPPVWAPEIKTEGRYTERTPVHASVLIGLVPRDDGLAVLFTQRTEHLSAHPGQISFPGGRAEPYDVDAAATALREADEEIALAASFVDVIGALPTYTTGSGFIVTPVVAMIRPGFTVFPEPGEVAEVFEVPLAFLMDPGNYRRHAVDVGPVRREFLSVPFAGIDATGQPRHYLIWGATAGMLRNLYCLLIA